MSINSAQRQLESRRRELERQRELQANEEGRAARSDAEAARAEAQAQGTSSAGLGRSYRQTAERRRADARRAREAAARASRAVANAQRNVHEAEAGLAKEQAREAQRAQEKARRERAKHQREQQVSERRQRDRERARDTEVAGLKAHASGLEARLRSLASQAPETIDVLFIAASPEDQVPLRLDAEVREIQERVRLSEYRDAVRFHWQPAARTTDLFQALNEKRPHVVHFSGHGAQSALIFEDSDGHAKELSNSDLAQLLRISSDRIRLAIFNTCDSAEQALLACDHIDAAVGMNNPINDDAAKVFAGQLYNTIGFGKSLSEAFEQAKLQVKLTTGTASGDPCLHTATSVRAEEIYLVRPLS